MRIFGMLVLLAGSASSAWGAGISCDQLASFKLPHVEITGAKLVAAGAFVQPPPNNPTSPQAAPAAPSGAAGAQGPQAVQGAANAGGQQARQAALYKSLPAFCRVTAISRPTSDSQIGIEVWLPAEHWNGRLAAGGNGGFQSTIPYQSLADAVLKGYTGTATDTGHQGNDRLFAIDHPEKLIDWDNRSLHEMAVTAKAVLTAFYGSAPKYSYFTACSTGGRQAEVAAEYFPNDWDGIVAGDAANPMTRLQAGAIYSALAVNKDDASFISADQWAMIKKAVVDQCDAKDGLKDGLVNDPRVCKFDTNSLLCKDGDTGSCLTAPQIEALDKITAGLKNPRTGEELYPGWPLGTPMLPGVVAGKTPDQNGVTTYRSLFNDADWDYHTIDFDRDVARADKIADATMNAVDEARLGKLFAHGGKMMIYHGWFDQNISALSSIEYYENAVKANGGLAKTYGDLRLFMIPNMAHCGGGDGPLNFDKLDVISDWVERGKAPDRIVASQPNPDGTVKRTRPLCPYPEVAKYKGSGSIDDAANFACSKP